jgi:hypothetical protein
MFARGAKASHMRKLELAASKPKRTHKKKHHVARVRNEELHEHNTAVTEAERRRLAEEAEANRNQDNARGTGGRRRTRRRSLRRLGPLARLVRNPTRRELSALLRRGGAPQPGYDVHPAQKYAAYLRVIVPPFDRDEAGPLPNTMDPGLSPDQQTALLGRALRALRRQQAVV